LQLQNNSALGVEVKTQKHIHALYASKFNKIWLLTLGMIYWWILW